MKIWKNIAQKYLFLIMVNRRPHFSQQLFVHFLYFSHRWCCKESRAVLGTELRHIHLEVTWEQSNLQLVWFFHLLVGGSHPAVPRAYSGLCALRSLSAQFGRWTSFMFHKLILNQWCHSEISAWRHYWVPKCLIIQVHLVSLKFLFENVLAWEVKNVKGVITWHKDILIEFLSA